MTVDARTSLDIVRVELRNCEEDCTRYRWMLSTIDEKNQGFTVVMKSPIDGELYIIVIKFDNYKEWPLHIEFVDPGTGERGTKSAYPAPNDKIGGFFHEKPCICHPCSRKAYQGYTDLHNDWSIVGWQQHQQVGALTDIRAILLAIYHRISNPEVYRGRMHV